MAYLDTYELAGYVSKRYYDEHGFDISPLKLQKTMYLLFAMWGGNARLTNRDIQEINRNDDNNVVEYSELFEEELFEANFEAWKYGPVDRELYKRYRDGNLDKISELNIGTNNNNVKSTIVSFIDSICAQTFKINDFTLVDLTHEDEVWISAYSEESSYHATPMNSDEIIAEYANRLSLRK